MPALLFDLDGTLVDTTPIQALRDVRNWRGCVQAVHTTVLYEGIAEMLHNLARAGVSIGIISQKVAG